MRFEDKCSCNNCGDCKIHNLETKCAEIEKEMDLFKELNTTLREELKAAHALYKSEVGWQASLLERAKPHVELVAQESALFRMSCNIWLADYEKGPNEPA